MNPRILALIDIFSSAVKQRTPHFMLLLRRNIFLFLLLVISSLHSICV
jgi:hypothetical protein